MPRRSSVGWWVAVVLALAGAVGAGCSPAPAGKSTEAVLVGRHHVWLAVPKGWERLDHGRQQLFRNGEAQISLVDLGPATRAGMVSELQSADSLWRAGRHLDAIHRIRNLRSPALRYAESQTRADFWKPWTDAAYNSDPADSFPMGLALNALIAGTNALTEATPDQMLKYVLGPDFNKERTEVSHQGQRTIHGSQWTDVETWSRVSHQYRSRIAYLVDDGYFLVLTIDAGVFEQAGPAFEALLTSIDVGAEEPAK